MKKVLMTMTMTMTMAFAISCMAQTPGSSTPSQSGTSGTSQTNSGSTQGTSGSNQGNSGTMQQGTGSPSNSGSAQPEASGSPTDTNSGKKMMKGEKSMKGCIRQSSGAYMLEEKDGKMVNLHSSEDLSAHVGHQVKVHGMWQDSGNSSTSTGSGSMNQSGTPSNSGSTSPGSMAAGGSGDMSQTFMIEKIDMVSDHCKMDKTMKNDSSMQK